MGLVGKVNLHASMDQQLIVIREADRLVNGSVADPGSGAFLTPGSGIRNRFFPDLESRILNPYIWELNDNFLCKKFYNSLKIGPNFFLQHLKTKIIFNLVKFVATYRKKLWQKFFFHSSLLLLFLNPGSEIRDPGWVKIRIRDPDPQHWPGSVKWEIWEVGKMAMVVYISPGHWRSMFVHR